MKRQRRVMTSIKIGKETATLLGVISRGRGINVEDLVLDALKTAYPDEVEAARVIIANREAEQKTDKEEK